MKNSTLAALVVIVIAIIGLGWWWYAKAPSSTTPADTQTQATTTDSGSSQTTPASDGAQADNGIGEALTVAVVATHNNASSCYTIIDGNVYDLTKWIPQHPGGQAAILSLCGHDGTAAFHGQHDDAKKQADILATFKIGVLVK